MLSTVCTPGVALLSEIKVDFVLPWAVIEVFSRGAPALDTDVAEEAAREVAVAEDRIALYGEPGGGGFLTSSSSPRVKVGDWSRSGQVLGDLLSAVEALDGGGIPGPYEAILDPERYYAYLRAAADGYPAARHLELALAGVHRSPALKGAGAVFSMRRGDFVITVGGDLSVGYRLHDAEGVHLFCVETVAAQAVTPEAVCRLG